MNDFITHNKDVLTFCVPLFGALLAMCFGGVLNFRHKICIDFESRRDVAKNILQDRFVQRTSAHYSAIASESTTSGVEVEELYRRKQQRDVIQEIARDLEDSNKVARYFRWLETLSTVALRSLWASIPLSVCPLLTIWLTVPSVLQWVWSLLLVSSLVVFGAAMSGMIYLDGRFFRLVNRIIEPEPGA